MIDFRVGDVVRLFDQLATVQEIVPGDPHKEQQENMKLLLGRTQITAWALGAEGREFFIDGDRVTLKPHVVDVTLSDSGEYKEGLVFDFKGKRFVMGEEAPESLPQYAPDAAPLDKPYVPPGDGGFYVEYKGKRYWFGCDGSEPMETTNSYLAPKETETPRMGSFTYEPSKTKDVSDFTLLAETRGAIVMLPFVEKTPLMAKVINPQSDRFGQVGTVTDVDPTEDLSAVLMRFEGSQEDEQYGRSEVEFLNS